MPSSSEIRQQFIDFFCKKPGHTFVPSSPVVPLDDPTLMFANAGMNQFKDVFLGTGSRDYKRAANTQKCIRAGGKHNDLDDVGKDTYHHTFFEMLGNWSFGDYFKKEAIEWAWELLTDVWQLDKQRLHVTVFEGGDGVPRDEEAAEFWHKVAGVPKERIHYCGKKDNFWEMGNTGPCGPCTEIHFDNTPDKSGAKLVNGDSDKVVEIWNLVFIQYNRNEDQSLTPLPAKHVDTGMGFERIVKVLQEKESNYDTDIFMPIFEAIQNVTGAEPYTGKMDDMRDTAYRVIADHIRTLTFALTDGANFGTKEREYVLRRILRRAERFGWQYFDTKKPFLCELVPTVVELLGSAFPELKSNPEKVMDKIRDEESDFIRNLDRGIKLFREVTARTEKQGKKIISGDDAFKLHDTYGFPIDVTEQMAEEVGLTVDRSGFERAMEDAKRRAREGRKKFVITAVKGELPTTDDSPKYASQPIEATVLGWVKDSNVVTRGKLSEGEEVALLLDRTNCYAEQGGQVGDFGVQVTWPGGEFEIEDTQRLGDGILHIGSMQTGTLEVGQKVKVSLGTNLRAETMRNHTATHLLNWALRKVLGDHIEQKGSLVDADKTRFDFSHDTPVTPEEMREIERLVNEKIYADLPVTPMTMPLADAKKLPGVRAVFGEKYPDPVRVLMIGTDEPGKATEEDSVEFCGGTHLNHTGQAGFFKIVSQEAVGKGIRRLTAVTGRRAVETVQDMSGLVETLAGRVNCLPSELPTRIEAMQEEIKKLQQQVKKGVAVDLQGIADKLFEAAEDVAGAKIIVGELPTASADQMRNQADRLRQKAGSAVVVIGWTDEDKVQLIASATDDLVKKGVHAGKLIGKVAEVVGGRGGGKPTMAQAGGKDADKLGEAMEVALHVAKEQLAK